MEIVGLDEEDIGEDLNAFADAVALHPWGGTTSGRLVVAEPDMRGLKPTMMRALGKWMKADEFEQWRREQVGRPVATAGKVFIADDDEITAVVCPIPDRRTFLGLASHELLEMIGLERQPRSAAAAPADAAQANGIVLLDEYTVDRTRRTIADRLGWSPSPLDVEPGLVSQTDDVVRALGALPADGWPHPDFWLHWVNVARVWAMVAGRADAGSQPEQGELEQWNGHQLINADGWSDVRAALAAGYDSPLMQHEARLAFAANPIFACIEALGREAWAASAPRRVARAD